MASEIVLYDPFGVQVDFANPPEAPPLMRGIPSGASGSLQDRYREYVSWNLSPGKIAEVLREADGGDPRRWILLCEEMLEKDPKLRAVAGTRKRSVKGLYWDVAPCELDEDADAADQAQALDISRLCSRVLRTTNFQDLLSNLLTAITKPFALSWIDWLKGEDGAAVPRFSTLPATHVRWAFAKNEIRLVDPDKPFTTGDGEGVPVEPWTTVRALYNPDEDHPTRGGLGRSVAYYELFKSIGVKDLVAYCERYGMPIRVLKIPDAMFKEEELRELYRGSMRDLGTDASAVISATAELEITAAAASTGDPFGAVINYCDKMIAQLYLGHELSSQSAPGPGQLGITAAMEVLQSVIRDDCQWIAEIVKRDVLRPIVGFNFGWEFERLTPELYFDFEEPLDLFQAANTLAVVGKALPGLVISEAQIRDTFGYEEPVDDDDALQFSVQSFQLPGGPPTGPVEPTPAVEEPPPPGEAPAQAASRAFTRRLSKRGLSRYRPARQRKLDRLAAKRLKAGQAQVAGWGKQLRTMLTKAAEDGKTLYEVRREIIKAYSELDVADLERMLREDRVLARLFGRSGAE